MHVTVEVDLGKFESGYTKLAQLEALLACTTGPGFAPFMSLHPDLKDRLLMLAADLAHEALEQMAILN